MRLPSSQNVPKVQQQRDPGIEVPRIPSPVESAVKAAAPVAEHFQQVQIKQQKRQDAIEFSRSVNKANDLNRSELLKLQGESDLSDSKILSGYGSFMTENSQSIIDSFNGSEDAKARLQVRLQDINAAYTGQAAGISAQLVRKNADRAFDESISPLVDLATQDPTIENLSTILSKGIPTAIEDLYGAWGPDEEKAKAQAAAEMVVTGTIDNLITIGNIDSADNLFNNGNMKGMLAAQKRQEYSQRIQIAKVNQMNQQMVAQSTIGRIRNDEKNGLITKEDAEAAIKKETQLARGNLNTPGQIVMATDLNPDLPDSYASVALIKQPNGSLQIFDANGGGKTTFFKQEQDDGTVAVYMEDGINPPQFIDTLKGPDGKPIKTGVSSRADMVQGRANVAADQRDRSLNLSESRLEQSIKQDVRTSENTLRDDFEKRAEPFRDQLDSLDKLEIVLAGDINGLDNKIITNLVSRAVATTNVRAQAELDAFKNFGDVSERLSGAISTFFTGKRTEEQLNQVRELIKEVKYQYVVPAMNELEQGYKNVAERNDINPDNVIVSGSKKVNTVEEAMKLPKGTVFIDANGVKRVR